MSKSKNQDNVIEEQRKMLTDLENRLDKEIHFSKGFLNESNCPYIEKKWMTSVFDTCSYSSFLIKILLPSLEDYKHLPKEQLGYFIGKIAIQSFLEMINSFELTMNLFIDENNQITTSLRKRIDEKIEIIEMSWNLESKGKVKKMKSNIKRQFENKITEMAFIRETLKKEGIIDETDFKILSFAWNIRNSIHMNFCAIKDLDFKYPDIKTGKTYHFKFKKGEELYHPDDLISFYIITEQIIFIMLKILQRYRVK